MTASIPETLERYCRPLCQNLRYFYHRGTSSLYLGCYPCLTRVNTISKDIVKGKCEILDVLTSVGFCYPALYDGRLQFHHEADSILFFLVNCD